MATSEKRQQAVAKIEQLPASEQLAVLDALIEKRRQKCYVRYFEPWSEQQEALKHFTGDKKIFGLLGGNRSGKTILGSFIAVAWALGKEYFRDEPAWEWVKDLPIPPPPNNVWVVGLGFDILRDVIWYEKLRHGKAHPLSFLTMALYGSILMEIFRSSSTMEASSQGNQPTPDEKSSNPPQLT